jgi:hypothetical protein
MKDKAVTVSQTMQLDLPPAVTDSIARKTGFMRRQPRKIEPVMLIKTLVAMTFNTEFSLRVCATVLGFLAGTVVSKEALFKRLGCQSISFVSHVLFSLLAKTSRLKEEVDKGVFSHFRRVFLHDSTNLHLPPELARVFPGAKNQTGKRSASLKLQSFYEVLTGTFHLFRLTPFGCNDQSASSLILEILKEGDLVLRDLGYFVLKTFEAISEKGAYFLSRYHHKAVLFDSDAKRFDLLKHLRKYGFLDQWLYIGIHERVPVRVVATPVPEPIAAQRRRKLRQNRNKEINPDKNHLALLGWEIFITNVGEQIQDTQTICQIYGLRWRIEIIFKSWKSYFHINAFEHPSAKEVKLIIYSRLIFITLFQTCFYEQLAALVYEATGKHLSLLKAAQFFQLHFWLAMIVSQHNPQIVIEQILKHCTYEKRKKRLNYGQIIHALTENSTG